MTDYRMEAGTPYIGEPMIHPLIGHIREAAANSELLRAVASVRQDGGCKLAGIDGSLRTLTSAEIRDMESNGNTSRSWQRVRVVESFDHRRVRGCSFFGDIVLGRFAGEALVADGIFLPTGIYDSTIVDSVVGDDSLVRNVRLLAQYVVCRGAVAFDCGSITANGDCRFANGTAIHVGPQVDSRQIPVFAEINLEIAKAIALRNDNQSLAEALIREISECAKDATCPKGVIRSNASTVHVGRLENTYVGVGCTIDGAAIVAGSTLLGSEDEPARIGSASTIIGSLLQWGAEVGCSTIVEQSVLMEHSVAGRHAKVANSIIGPNSSIEVGEVSACLIGPFVGAHHQSLLISVVWPQGRGNVAHGANVGSNHTSRCADQEFWPGEGMFFGLGVNLKFPANFARAPYSVVAPGLTLDPQRVEFPFSLIAAPSSPAPGLSIAYNEIQPGWMLDQNLYALHRIESKHRSRNHARRLKMDFDVIRLETVKPMRSALRRLESVDNILPFYTERDLTGLGRNVLFEPWRLRAINAYRRAIAQFALNGLRDQIVALRTLGPQATARVLDISSEDTTWEYQREILKEDLRVSNPVEGLKQLASLVEQEAVLVEQSRTKDHVRGCRVIDDYFERHDAPGSDEIVRSVRETAENECRAVRELIQSLAHIAEKDYVRA